MKVLFVGDPHFDSSTPLSRLDSYRKLTLDKLSDILEISINNNVKYVIMTGDVFDKLDQSLSYIHDLLTITNLFKDNNIEILSVIGNHDLKYNNMAYFDTTPLNLLFKVDAIKHLDTLSLSEFNTIIYGIDFNDLDKDITVDNKYYNVLVAHYALENTVPNESLDNTKVQQFNLVVSGHDHKDYPMKQIGNTTVLRPGSMTRRTRDEYNLTRDVGVYLLDLETKEITFEKLKSARHAKDVFNFNSFLKPTASIFSTDYNGLFTEDFFSNETNSINEMIDSLPMTIYDSTKSILKKHFKKHGLI